MANVDPAAIQTLRDLPYKHRLWLLTRFQKELKRSWRLDRKLEKIAQLLGPNGLQPYRNLYLDDNGSNFSWYLYPDEPIAVPAIYNKLTHKFPGVLAGLEPHLKPEDPTPKLHRVVDYGSYIAVEFASMDATRKLTQNWKEKTYNVDRTFRIVVRSKPFSIEVRAAGEERQRDVIDALAAELKLDLSDGERCELTTSKLRNQLERNLSASFVESDLRCTDDGISSMKLKAEAGKTLHKSAEYKTQMNERAGRAESRRGYQFTTGHVDGYQESSLYSVHLDSGDLRMSATASEKAIETLRQHVISLF